MPNKLSQAELLSTKPRRPAAIFGEAEIAATAAIG
jgi:hypothetical protein